MLQCGAALRLGELVALEVGDLSFEPKGVVLTIRRSKTESRRRWRDCGGFTGAEEGSCPVGALRRWLETAAIGAGLVVFRRTDRHADLGPTLSDRALAEIVAARAAAAGLEAISPGIRRAGCATAAARGGRSEAAIMRHGGSKSVFGAGDLAELNVGALPKEKSPTG